MSSGEHHTLPISSITIPPNRQRHTVNERSDTQLRESLFTYGLIHAIVVTRGHELVAGFRRLSQCRELGWTHITAQYLDEIHEDLREEIEFEENERRQDLTWLEHHDALMRLHERRKERDPSWTASKTAEAANTVPRDVSEHMTVERYKDNPRVAGADNFNKAYREAKRLQEREAADAWNVHNSDSETYASPIIEADFHEWARVYEGPPFNFLHCDFPYGINSQASTTNPSGYDDRPEVYWELIKTLGLELDRFCAPSAHMIFWCSANIELASNTFHLLKMINGFTWDEVPLIWMKSDGKGIAPDSLRRFRRSYELAFFGWRGDRKLIRLKDNIVSAQSDDSHPHAKPVVALQHFFEGLIDSNTRLLDPTCGAGSAIRAALSLGASAAIGIEKNAEYTAEARRLLA